ncbi:MAG: single-stranded-DNA-specific exonuclease RecJ [Balneolaceae bacterium]
MTKRWVFLESEQQEAVALLEEELGISMSIARLLERRRVYSFDQARMFFRPDLASLHDPFLMKDMEAAASRLARAIDRSEKILVYGDYDVDGTTATSIMVLFLRQFGLQASYRIPHRYKDGYGVQLDGIREAAEEGVDLIITVDCGITAIEEAQLARELGVDLIVCDHHTVGRQIPDALAVLDPKRPDCSYPFDGLSGAGVAFKLVQATLQTLRRPAEQAWPLLDLLALSIAADIVPVVDENRILMIYGLERINENPSPGIAALIGNGANRSKPLNARSIIFWVAPRINAAGRMGDASVAVELMISEDPGKARQMAKTLDEINKERQKIDKKTKKQAVAAIERFESLEEMHAMVLHDPAWHLGVIGIVASRMVDAYCRPAILLGTVDGKVKGSARSIEGFNIYDALKKCEDLLEQFGGHAYAAGLTLDPSNLEAFRERLNSVASSALRENDFEPALQVEGELGLDQVNVQLWKHLRQFEPFGPGNEEPIFVSRGVELAGPPAIVGNGHLKLRVRTSNSPVIDAIGFNMHEYLPVVREAKGRVDVAYVIEENEYRDRRTLQLRLEDLKPSQE